MWFPACLSPLFSMLHYLCQVTVQATKLFVKSIPTVRKLLLTPILPSSYVPALPLNTIQPSLRGKKSSRRAAAIWLPWKRTKLSRLDVSAYSFCVCNFHLFIVHSLRHFNSHFSILLAYDDLQIQSRRLHCIYKQVGTYRINYWFLFSFSFQGTHVSGRPAKPAAW